MKTIIFLVLFLLPSIAFAVDSFNGQTGELYMPNVSVDGSPFEVTMVHQGNLNFQVTTATPVSFPDHFSNEWLQGKTLYQSWYGFGNDASGTEVDGLVVIIKLTFSDNGIAQAEVVQNYLFANGLETSTSEYQVDGAGLLFFDNDAATGNVIIGHNSTCLTTEYLEDGAPAGGDIFCLTEQDARDMAEIEKYIFMTSALD